MNTILVPVDFSSATPTVVAAAAGLARALNAPLELLHVVQSPPATLMAFDRLSLFTETAEMGQLKDWQEKLANDGLKAEAVVRHGDPADSIRHEANRIGAGYIVIGSHGHGALYEIVLGGTVRRLLRQLPCPVILVPSAPNPRMAEEGFAEPAVAAGEEPLAPVATD